MADEFKLDDKQMQKFFAYYPLAFKAETPESKKKLK